MALHRDIYWVGKQWAVTGFGVQACDQKQKGKFDIEASRLWEDDLLGSVRSQKWLNIEDFDKALAIARARYPAPSAKAAPPEHSLKDTGPKEQLKRGQPKPVAQEFHMQMRGSAKLVPQWRIRIQNPLRSKTR
jgi:hypothetical protein